MRTQLLRVFAAVCLAAVSAPAAVAQNYEYSTTYQRNLTQIQVSKTLHTNLKAYIASYPSTSPRSPSRSSRWS